MVIELVTNIVGPEPTERDKNIRYHVRMGTSQVDFDFYVYDHFPVVKTMVEVRSKVDGTVYHRFTDTVEKRHWRFVDAAKRCLNNCGIILQEPTTFDTLLEISRKVCSFYYVTGHPFLPCTINIK